MKLIRLINSIWCAVFILIANTSIAQTGPTISSDCNFDYRQIMIGDCIGSKGIKAVDLDKDGSLEIVMANPNYWQIMEYNPQQQGYVVYWMSRFYGNTNIIELLDVFDIDHDGEPEIIVASSYIYVEIFNAETLELESKITLPDDYYEISGVLLADADNDGSEELVIGARERTFLYHRSGSDFEYEQEFSTGGIALRAADVNADDKIELVYPGKVMCIQNGIMSLVSQYSGVISDRLELYDVDSDGVPEIIYGVNGIIVYSVPRVQNLWFKNLTAGSDAFLLFDTDNDGTREIIIAESQTPNILCLNASDGEEVWSFEHSYYYGIGNLCAGDFNSDGNHELAVCMVCRPSGENSMHMYNIEDLTCEWTSIDLNPPFKVIRVADVDDDGQKELVSFMSGPSWSNYGFITVYDAKSGLLEWQNSVSDSLLLHIYPQIDGFEIFDIDNDGSTEIIIAGSEQLRATIWVINGNTHELESKHLWPWSTDVYEFSDLEITDVDNNGSYEYVVISGNQILTIDPQNYEILDESPAIPIGPRKHLVCGNIDMDPNPEFLSVHDSIIVYDPVTHETWSTKYYYDISSLYLYDYDGDGIEDVFAGTVNGSVIVINGITREVITLPVFGYGQISSLYVGNVSGEPLPELLFMTPEYVYFSDLQWNEPSWLLVPNDSNPAQTALEVADYDDDGVKEVFAGTNYAILELNTGCYGCREFDLQVNVSNAGCQNPDGSADAIPSLGHEPYSWLWSTGQTTEYISGIPSGPYTVTVTDAAGCSAYAEVIVPGTDFIIDSIRVSDDLTNTPECEGSVTIFPSHGVGPYRCLIEGDTLEVQGSILNNLCAGNYQATFIDAAGCTNIQIFQVAALTAVEESEIDHFSVYPVPAKNIVYVEIQNPVTNSPVALIRNAQGLVRKTVILDAARTAIEIEDLNEGLYFITVINSGNLTTKKLVIQ